MDIRLKSLRKSAGFKNRRQFSDALGDGYTERQIASWETGERMLSLEQACDIADLLDCTLDELAGRDLQTTIYSDPRQQALNHSYSLLDEKSKVDLAGIASTFTVDPSRLAARSGQNTENELVEGAGT